MPRKKVILTAIVTVALLPLIGLALMSLFSSRPFIHGVQFGRLEPCPDTPNCVCSQDNDDQHAIEPLPLSGSPADAIAQLKAVIEQFPRTQVCSESEIYLHAEFKSALFRFVDDVEFYIDEPAGIIHVRSASRVGRSDLGANRKRIEAIRKAFNSAEQQ